MFAMVFFCFYYFKKNIIIFIKEVLNATKYMKYTLFSGSERHTMLRPNFRSRPTLKMLKSIAAKPQPRHNC